LDFKDKETENISQYFDIASIFIKKVLHMKKKVLVASSEGKSRGIALAIAFVFKLSSK